MMNRRTLGLTNFNVSELCLGTMHFGWRTDEARAFEILDAFREAGGNFIQSVCYFPDNGMPAASPNRSEEVVGRWMASRNVPRTEVVLATRLVIGRGEGGNSLPRLLTAACHESVRRLGTSYLDLLVIEWSDALLPVASTLDAINDLVRTGVVQEYGVAHFPTWRVADSIARAYVRNRCRLEMVQADYSLLKRAEFEGDLETLCSEQRLGFVARAPLAGGLLYQPVAAMHPYLRGRGSFRRNKPQRCSMVEVVASRHEATVPQIALAWVLQNPVVASAIIGVRSADELKPLVAATGLQLDDADRKDLLHPYAGGTQHELTLV